MKRLLLTLTLIFSITLTFAQNHGANRQFRWFNEYMSFAYASYMNPYGPIENYIVLYNYSQETFETRVVIKEIGVDFTATVTPEGNSGWPGETWVSIGTVPELNDPNGNYPMMQVKVFARSENVQFHLSDTWFGKR